jgi:hypothetical protein
VACALSALASNAAVTTIVGFMASSVSLVGHRFMCWSATKLRRFEAWPDYKVLPGLPLAQAKSSKELEVGPAVRVEHDPAWPFC